MSKSDDVKYRGWEYAKVGDYHRNLNPNWSYTPTYLKKMEYVYKFIDNLPMNYRILDAGCGEGVLVEKLKSKGRIIEGIDLNYESEYVKRGDILTMPYNDNTFDVVLLLDVFEHLFFHQQPKALQEIRRVLVNQGILLASIPNIAHFNSRFNLFLKGRLDRTDIETNHPGERPIYENIRIIKESGFEIKEIKGITLTVPFIYRRIICQRPSRFRWLHDLLNIFALPSISMINIFVCINKK